MELKTPYFKKHIKWLLIFGVNISYVENIWLRYLYKIWSAFILTFIFSYGFLELMDVLTSSNLSDITFGLCYLLTHILGLTKIVILMVKKKQVKEIMDELESGDFLPNMDRGGEKEFHLINAAITRCDLHVDIFNFLVYVIVPGRCLYALFDTGYDREVFDQSLNITLSVHVRTLPYRIWLPFEATTSPIFEVMFFIQWLALTLFGHYISLVDAVIYGMIIHMNAQFLILINVVETYVSKATDLVSKSLVGKEIKKYQNGIISLPKGYERIDLLEEPVQKRVKEIVHNGARHHNHILDFCEKVETEFSLLMLLQFLFSLYSLCFQLYQLSLSALFSFEFISMCCFLMLLMYQLFCYCWYGNEILVTSGRFSEDLYNSNWLVLNDSTKKSLLLMMMRAQRPVQFTAGKFALLSLQTFMTIVRGSASYFMVLRQMSATDDN